MPCGTKHDPQWSFGAPKVSMQPYDAGELTVYVIADHTSACRFHKAFSSLAEIFIATKFFTLYGLAKTRLHGSSRDHL